MFKKLNEKFTQIFEDPKTKAAKEDIKNMGSEKEENEPIKKEPKKHDEGTLHVEFHTEMEKSEASYTTPEGEKKESMNVVALIGDGDKYSVMCSGSPKSCVNIILSAVGEGNGPFKVLHDIGILKPGSMKSMKGGLHELLNSISKGIDFTPPDELDERSNSNYKKKTMH